MIASAGRPAPSGGAAPDAPGPQRQAFGVTAFVASRSRPGLARWLTLGGACLVCVTVGGYDHLAVMAAIFVASLLSSIAGFAFSAICGGILFHLADDPVDVVQIMIICSIANQAAMTWAGRRDIDWRGLSVYLAGGALGLTIGVWVLLHAQRAPYTRTLGVFLLCYGGYMLFRKPVVIARQHAAFDFGSGFVGGITGGAAGAPSIPVAIWCSMKGWDKAQQRATFQPFILIMQVAALLAISFARTPGADGAGFAVSGLLFIPAGLMGTSLGFMLYRCLSDGQFARAVNVLLIASGLSYLG